MKNAADTPRMAPSALLTRERSSWIYEEDPPVFPSYDPEPEPDLAPAPDPTLPPAATRSTGPVFIAEDTDTSLTVASTTNAASTVAAVLSVFVAAAGFHRLVDGTSWVIPVFVAAATCAVISAACRRHKQRLAAAIAWSSLAVAFEATVLVYGKTILAGGFWESLGDVPHQVFAALFRSKAPVEVNPGVVLAVTVGVSIAVVVADRCAVKGSKMAGLPAAIIFVSGALTGVDRWSVGLSALYAASAVMWWALRRADTSAVSAAGRLSLAKYAVVFTAVAVSITVVVGPHLPGANSPAIIDWFNHGDTSTVSPLVEIGGKITNQSTTQLFYVDAPKPSYWRMDTLDRFDGKSWFIGDRQSVAFSSKPPGDTGSEYKFHLLKIDGGAQLLPAPPNPTVVQSSTIGLDWTFGRVEYGWRPSDRPDHSYDGVEYSLFSTDPPTPDQLKTVHIQSDENMSRWLELPAGFENSAAAVKAREVTYSAGGGDYDRLVRLQDWFRSEFKYNLNSDYTKTADPIAAFLDRRVGYCQQFAGTFAAMSRSLGYPTRVAIGFTAGAEDPTATGRYMVTGADAHAWPEVWFGPQYGWVQFEPTPSRTLNNTTTYAPPTPSPVATASPSAPPTTAINSGSQDNRADVPAIELSMPTMSAPTTGSQSGWGGLLAVVAMVGLFTGIDRLRRRVRYTRRRAGVPTDRLYDAWDACQAAFAGTSLARRVDESAAGWSRRVSSRVDIAAGLPAVADSIEAHLFGDVDVDEGDASHAEGVADRLGPAVRFHPACVEPRQSRLARMLASRPHVAPGAFVVMSHPGADAN